MMTDQNLKDAATAAKLIASLGGCDATVVVDTLVGYAWGEEDATEILFFVKTGTKVLEEEQKSYKKLESEHAALMEIIGPAQASERETTYILQQLVNLGYVEEELVKKIRAVAQHKKGNGH